MTDAVYLPCRCGNPRNDLDAGTGLCRDCRAKTPLVTTHEMLTSFERCRRDMGGATPRVAWITERAPQVIWNRLPGEKENPTKVMIVPVVDEDSQGRLMT